MSWLFMVGRVWATWSIIAVDPETAQVGIAGATCGPMVWGIAGLAPGHGVVAAQYATWVGGRDDAVDLLMGGSSPDAALDAVIAADDQPELRQWAMLSLDGAPVGYTGAEVERPAAIVAGDTWSVQGNTLANEAVVTATAERFEASEGSLAERLVSALGAGAEQGGDHRCDPADAARSAFVYVAAPDDRAGEPTVELRVSGKGAVAELAERFAEGDRSCHVGGAPPGWGLLVLGMLVVGGRRADPE